MMTNLCESFGLSLDREGVINRIGGNGAYTRQTPTFFDSHIQMAIKPQCLNANRRLMALYEGEDLPSPICGALDANMARVQAHLSQRRGGINVFSAMYAQKLANRRHFCRAN